MGFFSGSKKEYGVVSKVTVFPSVGSVVLRKDKKLIVFSPQYLLGKHGGTTKEVASKFLNLNTAKQLLELIDDKISSKGFKRF